MAKPDPQTGGSQSGRTPNESESPKREAAGGDSEVKSLDEQWGFKARKGGMAAETKAGLAIIAILVCAFGYIAFNKYNRQDKQIVQTEPTARNPAKSKDGSPPADQPATPSAGDFQTPVEPGGTVLAQSEPSADDWGEVSGSEAEIQTASRTAPGVDAGGFEAPVGGTGFETDDAFGPVSAADSRRSETAPPPPGETEQRDTSWALADQDDPWGAAATEPAGSAAASGAARVDSTLGNAAPSTAQEPGAIDPGFDANPIEQPIERPAARVAADSPDNFEDIFSEDAALDPPTPGADTREAARDPWDTGSQKQAASRPAAVDPNAFDADAFESGAFDTGSSGSAEISKQNPSERSSTGLSGRAVVTPAVQSREPVDFNDAPGGFDDAPVTFDDPPVQRSPEGREPVETGQYRRETAPRADPWETATPVQPAQSGRYVIRTSDTFWSISKAVYSTARYYKGLARYNRDLVPDPRRMRPGLELRVPDPSVLEREYPDLFPTAGGTAVAAAEIDTRQPPGLYVDGDNRPVYRVGRNDSLSRIAHRHLGRSSRWVQIYELNRRQLTSPSAIRPGMLLAMPSDASQVSSAASARYR